MANHSNAKKLNEDKITINYTDMDIDKLSFTDLEENERSKGQKIAFPRYDHIKFGNKCPICIQFPWINLNSYGVPKIGEYYKEDSQRLFLKIPLDQSDPTIKAFSDFIKSIDTKLSSAEFMKSQFGQKSNKYKYQPIFRLPLEDDDDDDKIKKKKNYGPKHPYMKLKLDYTYPDLKIKSKVFISNYDSEINKRIRTKINDIVTVDDFSKYVSWKSAIHPIGQPIKLWAQNPSKNDPTYGLSFRLVQVETEPSKENSNIDDLDADAFLDSDNENDIKLSKPTKIIDKEDTNKVGTKKDDSKSSSSKELLKEVPKELPKELPKESPKKPVLVESESEKDEESEDESDDSNNSDIKPAKKIIPKAKPKGKK
uniref:Uncharacterized protein n=1 Tax=viral metagenome TaxID=1070528 RepID=A0A6C0ECV6_9ZZZZ